MNNRQIAERENGGVHDPFAAPRRDLSEIRETLDREQARLMDVAAMLDQAWEAIHESQSRIAHRPDRLVSASRRRESA